MEKKKLGIMGGTFDPIHLGHLQCADIVQKEFNLEKVLFIPAGIPNFKQDKKLASAQDRLKMCRLAIADFGNPTFDVSDTEINRKGVTYTVDTLKEFSEYDIYFITGTDSAATLEQWHNYEEILKLCTVVAVTRKGDVKHKLNQKILLIKADVIEVSSTEIRHSYSIKDFVTQSVYDYIKTNRLYSI